MDQEKAEKLIEKYLNGTCSPEEKALVERFYMREAEKRGFDGVVNWEKEKKAAWKKIAAAASEKHHIHIKKLWYRLAAAASVIFILSAGLHFYFQKQPALPEYTGGVEADISAGGNKAVLTLADGTRISLDDASTGEIARQSGIRVTKTADGKLIYDASARSAELIGTKGSSAYNTITTPRGGQYEVILPDGTKVWLNAASSLKYPAWFRGNERRVELNGEAYFEAAHNKDVPFRVTAGAQTVEVLGTEFNINSYADELSVKTTLLKGSVKVSAINSGASVLLKPGEQSELAGNQITVAAVDAENAAAWKNGLFRFHNSDVKSVMRQYSRWYDVEVEFEGEVPAIRLWGEVYRTVSASKALEILSYFNLKYRIVQNGKTKKIIVSQ